MTCSAVGDYSKVTTFWYDVYARSATTTAHSLPLLDALRIRELPGPRLGTHSDQVVIGRRLPPSLGLVRAGRADLPPQPRQGRKVSLRFHEVR